MMLAPESATKVDEVHDNVNDRIDAHKANEREKAKTAVIELQ